MVPMARDGYVTICEHLLPVEAGMAKGLLESAGIEVLVEDVHLSSVDPLVRLAISGAKVLVPAADAAAAREVLASGGVAIRGGEPPEPIDIPEAEWSKPAAEEEASAGEASGRFARSLPWLVAGGVALAVALRACAGR